VTDAESETRGRPFCGVMDDRNRVDEPKLMGAREQRKLVEDDEGTEVSMTVGKGQAATVRTSMESEMRLMTSPAVAPALTVCRQRAVRRSWGHRSRDKCRGRSQ
jgi:hypothetical protein